MRRAPHLMILLLVLLASGCPQADDDGPPGSDDDDVADDDDTVDDDEFADDDDTVDDDDSGDDDDAVDDDDSAVQFEELSLEVSATELSTRDVLEVTVTAHYDEGSTVEVTDEAVIESSDEAVLRFYQPTVGQPLGEGTAIVTASWKTGSTLGTEVAVSLAVATAGDLVINEFLADGAVDGDPNGDGSTDPVEDEFLEIANTADAALDLAGVTILELDHPFAPRHTFADGTVLAAGEAIVVFGGGDVSTLVQARAQFVVVVNGDPGLPNGLSLRNAGDAITLVAADGVTDIHTLAYGDESDGSVPAPSDESAVLDPEVWGSAWLLHSEAAASA